MEIDISMITEMENHEVIGNFFAGFALPKERAQCS